jgi:predicted nuclease of predicted toxin-antitoxin system
MIIADENVDFSIIKAIRNLGIEVCSVSESHSGISDPQVIQLSLDSKQIILTEDKDFGEWVYAHNITGISVIFLRYDFSETAAIRSILVELLQMRLNDLAYNTFNKPQTSPAAAQ